MRGADCGDAPAMPGNRQPIVHSGANPPSFQGWIAFSLMPGDEQQNPFPGSDSPVQGAVDLDPRAVEAVAVKVQYPVGLHPARAQAPVPAPIERRVADIFDPFWR